MELANSIIFSLDGREDFKEEIIQEIKHRNIGDTIINGEADIKVFSDHEISISFKNSVRGKIVYILTSPNNSDEIMKLNFAINAARINGASQIIPILPYYPYARQDKMDVHRSSIGSKVIAEMIENRGATSVILFDLHAEQIQSFFSIPVIHINGKDVFDEYIYSQAKKNPNLVLCSGDVGGTKRVKKNRDHVNEKYNLNLNFVIIDKTRKEANKVEGMILIGDVNNKDVILLDDLIDTGNTIAKACDELIKKGASSVKVICTHGVLSGKAYEVIGKSSMSELVTSNSLAINREVKTDLEKKGLEKIKTISVATQVALTILAISNNVSYESIK